MFRIHLRQNKDIIIGLGIIISLLILFLVNVVFLIPEILTVYTTKTVNKNTLPIDTETVNRAVDALTGVEPGL